MRVIASRGWFQLSSIVQAYHSKGYTQGENWVATKWFNMHSFAAEQECFRPIDNWDGFNQDDVMIEMNLEGLIEV